MAVSLQRVNCVLNLLRVRFGGHKQRVRCINDDNVFYADQSDHAVGIRYNDAGGLIDVDAAAMAKDFDAGVSSIEYVDVRVRRFGREPSTR